MSNEFANFSDNVPYILAYKSLPRISRPPKKRVPVWSKIVDPRISRGVDFEDLYALACGTLLANLNKSLADELNQPTSFPTARSNKII